MALTASRGTLAQQVGAELAKARGARSLRDFAREHGLAVATIHELEQGHNNPTLARLERVAALYGVELRIVVEPARK